MANTNGYDNDSLTEVDASNETLVRVVADATNDGTCYLPWWALDWRYLFA